jgi:hypothetical protein
MGPSMHEPGVPVCHARPCCSDIISASGRSHPPACLSPASCSMGAHPRSAAHTTIRLYSSMLPSTGPTRLRFPPARASTLQIKSISMLMNQISFCVIGEDDQSGSCETLCLSGAWLVQTTDHACSSNDYPQPKVPVPYVPMGEFTDAN